MRPLLVISEYFILFIKQLMKILGLMIILFSFLSTQSAYSSSAPTINSNCDPGGCGSQSCDFSFYIDSSTYLAQNCVTTRNDFKGTDFNSVYSNTVASCPPTHCSLEFRGGFYTITSALNVQSYYSLTAAYMQSVNITLANNSNTRMITTPSTTSVFQFIVINGITLSGNKANNPSSGQCIYLQAWRSRINNVLVSNCKGTPIEISGLGLTNFAIENIISHSAVDNFDGAAGIFINQRAPDNFLHHNVITQQGKQHTCLLIDSADTSVTENHIYGCVEGVRIRGVTDILLIGNTIESMNTVAIVLQVTTAGFPVKHVDIEANTFFADGLSPINTNPEISLVGLAGPPVTNVEGTIILGNSFRSVSTAYIVQGNGFTNTTLVANNVMANSYTLSAINGLVSGTDKVRSNIGWITENQGSCSISSSTSCSVAHGLAGIPTSIIVTAGTIGTGVYYVSSVGTTTFTINVSNSGTYTMYWEADYWP